MVKRIYCTLLTAALFAGCADDKLPQAPPRNSPAQKVQGAQKSSSSIPFLIKVKGDRATGEEAKIKLALKNRDQNEPPLAYSLEEPTVETDDLGQRHDRLTGTYLVSLRSVSEFSEFEEYVQKNTGFFVGGVQVDQVKIKSFVKLTYTKPILRSAKEQRLFIGETEGLRSSVQAQSLQDIYSYTRFPQECREVTPSCFKVLSGYINETSSEGNLEPKRNLDTLRAELDQSVNRRADGNEGGNWIKPEVVDNVSIEHEVFVNGSSHGKWNLNTNGQEFLKAPLTPASSSIPVSVRANNESMRDHLIKLVDSIYVH